MADMTGGLTRVANLRDGIFGPPGNPGQNRLDPVVGFGRSAQELGSLNGIPLTADDWAARYAAWMGLGGTRATIPVSIVSSIGVTEILGVRSGIRLEAITGQQAANMLEVARVSCLAVAPNATSPEQFPILFDPERGALIADPDLDGAQPKPDLRSLMLKGVLTGGDQTLTAEPDRPLLRPDALFALGKTGFITTNGHAALWQALCSVDNPAPVRVVEFDVGTFEKSKRDGFYVVGMYRRSDYPRDAAVGDGSGQTRSSLDANNLSPWCVVRPPLFRIKKNLTGELVRTESIVLDRFEDYQRRTGRTLPICPANVALPEDPGRIVANPLKRDREVEDWALRGAMNAGMSVFLYLDALSKGKVKPVPAYNHCEELGR
jgi:hypothetical protein